MKPRATARLSTKLERSLLAYATVATAAGMGVVSAPVSAEVVYTPAHEIIGPNTSLPLDLNHDGIVDFSFKASSNFPFVRPPTGSTSYYANLWVYGGQEGNGVAENVHTFTKRIKPAHKVGSHNQFGGFRPMAFCFIGPDSETNVDGPWLNGVLYRQSVKGLAGFVGLKFLINGETHYGWARVKVTVSGNHFTIGGILKGYAYETVPDQPIATTVSQPASLGHLALGAADKRRASVTARK